MLAVGRLWPSGNDDDGDDGDDEDGDEDGDDDGDDDNDSVSCLHSLKRLLSHNACVGTRQRVVRVFQD